MREAILTKGIFKFMKSGTKSVLRILISIVYIIWGIMAPVTAFQAIIALDINAIISAAMIPRKKQEFITLPQSPFFFL